MHKLKYLTISIILLMLFSLVGSAFDVSARPLSATSPTLGAAESYSVLAAAPGVTNTGPTTMPGNLGASSGGAIVNFPPGVVGPPGAIIMDPAANGLAQVANTAAFDALSAAGNSPCTVDYGNVVTDLTGLSLGPGVYCTDLTGTTGAFKLTGDLFLTGSGVWIFRSGSTLITSGTARVVGGDPCNVWWKVPSSATLGTGTQLIGNILALTAIQLQTGATLNGRALSQGAVTLDTNTITGLSCLTFPPGPTATPRHTRTPGGGGGGGGGGGVNGLPNTGGAPIRNEDFPWSLLFVGGFSVIALFLIALFLGIRAYGSRSYLPKK